MGSGVVLSDRTRRAEIRPEEKWFNAQLFPPWHQACSVRQQFTCPKCAESGGERSTST